MFNYQSLSKEIRKQGLYIKSSMLVALISCFSSPKGELSLRRKPENEPDMAVICPRKHVTHIDSTM